MHHHSVKEVRVIRDLDVGAREVELVHVGLSLENGDGHEVLDLGDVVLEDLLVHLLDLLVDNLVLVHVALLHQVETSRSLSGEVGSESVNLAEVEVSELLEVDVEDLLELRASEDLLLESLLLVLVFNQLDSEVLLDSVAHDLLEGLRELLSLVSNGIGGQLQDLGLNAVVGSRGGEVVDVLARVVGQVETSEHAIVAVVIVKSGLELVVQLLLVVLIVPVVSRSGFLLLASSTKAKECLNFGVVRGSLHHGE